MIHGMGEDAAGAWLFQRDSSLVTQSKAPHTLLKADGMQAEIIVPSVRGPVGQQYPPNTKPVQIRNCAIVAYH